MKRFVSVLLLCLATLTLTACITREQADAKLANGCKAGVNAFLDNGQIIDKITATKFDAPKENPDLRRVTLTATLKDDWSETPNQYECLFDENFGPFNTNYEAMIHRIKIGEKTIGKTGNEIEGTLEDFTKLGDATIKGMGQ